jgi:hypothetical protein
VADRVPDPLSEGAGVAAEAYGAVALGGGRVRLDWAGADAPGQGGAGAHPPQVPRSATRWAAERAESVQWEAAGFGDAHSARLARLILSEVVSDAATVQRQASGQSAAISEAAEREAAEIRRQASAQSAAIREAAEREAAELRAAMMEMPAGAGGVVYVTEDLVGPAKPGEQLTTHPATSPATKPPARPGTRKKGRQVRAMRKVMIAFVAFLLVGVISGAVEVAMHGFSFFLFRNTGAGAGNSHNLNENQGPGQPDAPGAHHNLNPG